MKLTCKFVKSILPKKVHKYICKDYCGDRLQVWINFGFWDIDEKTKTKCLEILYKNKIRCYRPYDCQPDGYFLFKRNEDVAE